MKLRMVPLVLSLVLIVSTRSFAQRSRDQLQANLVANAHFKALTMAERIQLLARAQSGDAEAQYWWAPRTQKWCCCIWKKPPDGS